MVNWDSENHAKLLRTMFLVYHDFFPDAAPIQRNWLCAEGEEVPTVRAVNEQFIKLRKAGRVAHANGTLIGDLPDPKLTAKGGATTKKATTPTGTGSKKRTRANKDYVSPEPAEEAPPVKKSKKAAAKKPATKKPAKKGAESKEATAIKDQAEATEEGDIADDESSE